MGWTARVKLGLASPPVDRSAMDSLFTFQEELKSETKNLYQEIRKNSAQHDSYNRLHSIQHDIGFVRKVAEEWYDAEFKVVANQRCGSWYTDPDVSITTVINAMLRNFNYLLTFSQSSRGRT
jgi:hypothetical protein